MSMHRCPHCGELLSSPARYYACPQRGNPVPPAVLPPEPPQKARNARTR